VKYFQKFPAKEQFSWQIMVKVILIMLNKHLKFNLTASNFAWLFYFLSNEVREKW